MLYNQYDSDVFRLTELVKNFTNIPKKIIFDFLLDNNASLMLSQADSICQTESQKEKLIKLFEFKNLYENIKNAEINKDYKINSVAEAKEYLINLYADTWQSKEYFYITFLNVKNIIIKTMQVSAGTLSQCHIYPREIVREAISCNAASIILSHNHPSGFTFPSKQDVQITNELKEGLEKIGIHVLDHIVIANEYTFSFAEQGLIFKGDDRTSFLDKIENLANEENDFEPLKLRLIKSDSENGSKKL